LPENQEKRPNIVRFSKNRYAIFVARNQAFGNMTLFVQLPDATELLVYAIVMLATRFVSRKR